MFTTLNELKVQELRTYPLAEVVKVLDALRKVSLSQMDYVAATETLDSYLLFVDIINERICNDDFKPLSEDKKTEFLKYIKKLRERLDNFKVISSFMLSNQRRFYSYVDKLQIETIEKVNEKTGTLTEKIITEKIDTATKRLDDSEHNILTHVLTLMGVFSAIIITIMSVVITATSWLNSSNSSDAITAFVVPAAVTIITVILLLAVVYGLYGDRKGRWFFYIYISIVAITLVVIVCQYKYLLDKNGEVTHTRYIIEQSEYEIVEIDNVQCYQFKIDNMEYVCPFDKMLIHDDGALHFCIQHEAIE